MSKSPPYPALFLDRDGVINKEDGYIDSIARIQFTESIFDLCRFFKQKFYKIIIVTNQSGIGRGIISLDQYDSINSFILNKFEDENCAIDLILTASVDPTNKDSNPEEIFLRKPNPGMILKAKLELNLNLNESLLIGDNLIDMQAGKSAMIPRLYAVKTPPIHSDYFESFIDLESCLVRLKHVFHT
jgi:D-glycero-D-manno-heptose 1,7-bisphosphate phosphatase